MKTTPEEVYDATSGYSAEWKDAPFDVAAVLTALAGIEPYPPFDLDSVGKAGDQGLWQDTHGYVRAGDDLVSQAAAIRPLVADAMAYIRRIRTWFYTHPDLRYDARDEFKWFDLVWNWGGPRTLSYVKNHARTSEAPLREDTAAGARSRSEFLRIYNRMEDRAAHPWITKARDAAQAAADAARKAAHDEAVAMGEAFGQKFGDVAEDGLAVVAALLGVLIALEISRRASRKSGIR